MAADDHPLEFTGSGISEEASYLKEVIEIPDEGRFLMKEEKHSSSERIKKENLVNFRPVNLTLSVGES
ncbi:hypothetical protein BTVI_73975 [Pitangus sulphuratus]|nr:hypothetical protein BTVI_73975 [Pitangus sulphuratus]